MIENIFKELYKAPAEFRWALANSGLGKLITGVPMEVSTFGRQGRLIRRLVGVACVFGAARLLVALVAWVEVARVMYQSRKVQSEGLVTTCRIFVGFGAGLEEQMWSAFEAESGGPAIRLDETRPVTFLAYHRPRAYALFKHIWRASAAVVPFLSNTALEPVASNRKDTITYAALRMGKYILYRTWWQEVEQASISQVVFLSAETPAFACIDAGIWEVEYRQHGLHRKSILMPAFSRLKMLTQIEADWYRQYLPQVEIEVLRPTQTLVHHVPRILIASVYDMPGFHKKKDLARVESLIQWAHQNNIDVRIRKHPREVDDFWERHFPELQLDATPDCFIEAQLRLQPMFVASWFSTSLVDALLVNVVPLSVMQLEDRHLQDMVFEVPRHCLLWPQHQSVMDALISGDESVYSVVSELLLKSSSSLESN